MAANVDTYMEDKEGDDGIEFEMDEPDKPTPPHHCRGCLKNILCFTATFSLASLLLETLKSYTVSQITALEKQFGLSSTRSGLLLSCNEIGYLSTIVFISHFGRKRHVPRILACGLILYGLCGICAGLLNFAHPVVLPDIDKVASNNSTSVGKLCENASVSDVNVCLASHQQTEDSPSNRHWIFVLLSVCMVVQGTGKSPRFSLGLPFVDNNSRDKPQSSLLFGVIMTITFFGGSVALYLGGVFSSIPVDLSNVNLDRLHPKWLGAWWIGYLVFGSMALAVAIPLSLFPRHINERSAKLILDKSTSLKDEVTDLPKSVFRVLSNPVVTILLIANCSVLLYVGGSIPFSPKYIQNQFAVPAYKVNFIVGTEEFLWAVGGTLAGGILTCKLKLTNRGCVTMTTLVTSVATAIYACSLGLGCDNQPIKGLGDGGFNMTITELCQCDAEEFFPVCGSDRVTYSSPCIAGCRSQNGSMYSGCSEIPGDEARTGRCEWDCPYLIPYVAVDLIAGLSGTISIVPVLMTMIKMVEPRDKSMVVALTSFLNGLLGFLPGPLLYGSVIDSTCSLWETSCGKVGACILYDLPKLRYRLKGMDVGFQALSACGFFASFLLFKFGVVSDKTRA